MLEKLKGDNGFKFDKIWKAALQYSKDKFRVKKNLMVPLTPIDSPEITS